MLKSRLFDLRMADGSRHFGDLPEVATFDKMRDHLQAMAGAQESAYVTDQVTEMWLDFEYRDHRFSINNQMGDYWFFVGDPYCPQAYLIEVLEHFSRINPE